MFALASLYLSFTLVKVVGPANAKGENDDILGVLTFYVLWIVIIGTLIIYCAAQCD